MKKYIVEISETAEQDLENIICINEFAKQCKLTSKEAYLYLRDFKGIEFLKENYEAEHTLGLNDAIDDLKQEKNKMKMEKAEALFNINKFKGASNRAYYSIFHAIKAILALEQTDFKKHQQRI